MSAQFFLPVRPDVAGLIALSLIFYQAVLQSEKAAIVSEDALTVLASAVSPNTAHKLMHCAPGS